MLSEQRIVELLVKWEEARERGETLSLQALTDDPAEQEQLAAEIRKITNMEVILNEPIVVPCLPAPTPPSFPGYNVLEEIDRGGMGIIWKAEQRDAGCRPVAIKLILKGQFATEQAVLRFRHEINLVAGLDHPNIVPIYDVGLHQGQHYFVMKFMDGGSLKSVAGNRTFMVSKEGQRRAASIMATVARAVHHAHQRGVIHRDLKPANILLAKDGTPAVTDFGLAKSLQGNPGLTPSTDVVGTPSYMAPEQAMGKEKGIIQSDVYSLGAVLYELLTGKPPFEGISGLDTVNQVLHAEPKPPRKIEPQVDRDLEIICLKCLDKDPIKRYASADDLAADLDRWGKGEPIKARPVKFPERAWRWCKRKPGIAALCTALVLVTVGGLIGILWQFHATQIERIKVAAEAQEKRQAQLASQRLDLFATLNDHSVAWFIKKKAKAKTDALQTLARIQAFADDNPDDKPSRILLASAKVTMGEILAFPPGTNTLWEPTLSLWLGRPLEEKTKRNLEEALEYYDSAMTILRELQDDRPDAPPDLAKRIVFTLQKGRAFILGQLRRFTESLMALDQAIPWIDDPADRQSLSALRIGMLLAAEGEQSQLPWSRLPNPDHAKAVSLADYLANADGVAAAAVYNAACALALAAGDTTVTQEEQERRAAKSVAYLERIERKGYFRNTAKLKELGSDTDLEPLRHRVDFNEMLERIRRQ